MIEVQAEVGIEEKAEANNQIFQVKIHS